jgi:DNA-binding XRE family transcriptional regulator
MNKTKKTSIIAKPRKYVLVSPTTTLESSFPKNRTSICSSQGSIVEAAGQADKGSIWISETTKRTVDLENALYKFYGAKHGKVKFGKLFTMGEINPNSQSLLSGWFDRIYVTTSALPKEELAEVLVLPEDIRKDLFIGGRVIRRNRLIVLVRGDMSTLVVPFSMFSPSPTARPNFRDFGIGDYGNTLRFGNYESTADVVLWEMDADYRKRTKDKAKQSATGLGPALRRLRIQRGLSQSDFGNISRKTISRVENGEIEKPQKNTLETIARRLNVKPEEIESY